MAAQVIDLFAGVGGLSEGFRASGFAIALANEWDPSIANAYSHNHPETRVIVDDITQIEIPKVFGQLRGKTDVIIGGPPCQGFSQKGQRKSINDERNYLFRHFVSVVDYIRPKFFVMENVPTLLTNEGGLFKREIEGLFESLGYSVVSAVLNAAEYGVPQQRRRAIILGGSEGVTPSMPPAATSQTTIWDAISDLAYLGSGEGSEISPYVTPPETPYQLQARKGSSELFNHRATKHSAIALERLSLIPPGGGKEFLPEEHRTKSIYSGTWTRMDPASQSVTITTRFDTPSSGRFTSTLR